MGVGGSCVSAKSNYGTGNYPLINRYQNIPDKDLITIYMGTNDYGHNTPMGTIDDTTDVSFYGALNVIIPGIIYLTVISTINRNKTERNNFRKKNIELAKSKGSLLLIG